jgi:hypothetical protein
MIKTTHMTTTLPITPDNLDKQRLSFSSGATNKKLNLRKKFPDMNSPQPLRFTHLILRRTASLPNKAQLCIPRTDEIVPQFYD